MGKYKVEELNYTDTDLIIQALTHYLGASENRIGTYYLDLLRKLERNKRVLYDQGGEYSSDYQSMDDKF